MSDTKNINIAEKPLTSVMEDYLEAIYDLDKDQKVVRVRDIAKKMDVKMPSVTSMLKTLNERKLVHYEKYEYVELTEHGAAIGREIRQRHEIIRKFLTEILQIDFKTADEDACKIEHTLSPSTLDRLTDFIEFIQICPMGEDRINHLKSIEAENQKKRLAYKTIFFASEVRYVKYR
ncbi:MAG: metal-dependent transcriptional regulator [Desulfobacteraceae bacterium]|nr:metal-dependent transcriptional regulator [Desulfobacteraceae bacterium]